MCISNHERNISPTYLVIMFLIIFLLIPFSPPSLSRLLRNNYVPKVKQAILMWRENKFTFNARIPKVHSHSMSGSSIWASLERHCCFWIAGGLVPYLTMRLLTLQLFKNSTDTQEKLRLNLHSLSESELLEYRRKRWFWPRFDVCLFVCFGCLFVLFVTNLTRRSYNFLFLFQCIL